MPKKKKILAKAAPKIRRRNNKPVAILRETVRVSNKPIERPVRHTPATPLSEEQIS